MECFLKALLMAVSFGGELFSGRSEASELLLLLLLLLMLFMVLLLLLILAFSVLSVILLLPRSANKKKISKRDLL